MRNVPTMDGATTALQRVAQRHPQVRLLVLLGSRARGDEHSASDWDLGVLADAGLDLPRLSSDVVLALGTEDVDVVDLATASAVLRRDAAAHGRPVFEREPGAFLDFSVEAALFWCDIEPVVREAHAAVLETARH